jgi:ribosomal protein S18 acetylase RimI-like enzyme
MRCFAAHSGYSTTWDTREVPVRISDARTDVAGLDEVEPLWIELHRHHRDVSRYRDLVDDLAASWDRRLDWYRRLLRQGGCYLTARDDHDRVIGYAMLAVEDGPDDTFATTGGIVEVVTLVVSGDHRSAGVGRALLSAAELAARERGIDTVKIAVMAGNERALAFYEGHGYGLGEHVLYRRLTG